MMTHRNAVTMTTFWRHTLHGKGSTNCRNSDSTSHSIISRCGLEIFIHV